MSHEDQLRHAMAQDAAIVFRATAHWREGKNFGNTPSNKGRLRPGSAPDRLLALMIPGQIYTSTDAAALLYVPSMRAADVLRQLADKHMIERRDCPDRNRPVFERLA